MRAFLLATLICLGFTSTLRAQQFITVDFSSGQLWHHYGQGQRDVYPIVLPKSEVQQQMNFTHPVLGELNQADYKPTWWPTQNMRRNNPALPSSIRYGQRGHPIGIYRLRIGWMNPNNPSFWGPVRIHGGAKYADLYEAESAGCVRMLDEDIVQMVENINQAQQFGEPHVQVSFGFFQK